MADNMCTESPDTSRQAPKGILKQKGHINNHVHNKNLKKGRLIIRNLSFKVSESKLKEEFSKFGDVTEVSIPTNPDGRKRGFAFVQFDKTQAAIRAINGLNAKKILDRPIAVDFALSKQLYGSVHVPREDHATTKDNSQSTATEPRHSSPVKTDEEDEQSEEEDLKMTEESDDELSAEEKEPSDEESDEEDQEEMEEEEQPYKKPRKRPSDAKDGCTLFIRNLGFQSEEDDLEELLEEFGEVKYVVICFDPKTELPRGTAFVRFSSKQEAQKCLDRANDELQGGLVLDGRRLSFALALPREEVVQNDSKKLGKDNRNLYLAREGLIRQGTQSSKDISAQDMALRTRLESRKRKTLRNLHFFVSRTRLCVHNIPPGLDNRQLKALFLRATESRDARITEARIMKENHGFGKSKGFGFVEFTEHEHALAALRQLNNNPDVFLLQRRPIVEFSIENRNAINVKLKRKENMQNMSKKKPGRGQSSAQFKQPMKGPSEMTFAGYKSRRDVKNMPSHLGPKIRRKKPAPAGQALPKKGKGGKKEKRIQGAREENDFKNLVNKYKSNLSNITEIQKQKWYDKE